MSTTSIHPDSAGLLSRLEVEGSVIGGWCMLGSALAAEVLSRQPLGYITIDCEHGAAGYEGMLTMLSALGQPAEGAPVRIVRVPSAEASWVGWALDAGAEAVIFPCVPDAAAAAAAAAACRFAPEGVRSYGPIRASRRLGSSPEEINAGVACIVMIESPEGLAAVDEICVVPGVDVLYVGPADLAISMGLGLGALRSPMHPDLVSAIEKVRDACLAHGVVPGIHAFSGKMARQFLDMGFRMVTAVSDTDALAYGAKGAIALARGQ